MSNPQVTRFYDRGSGVDGPVSGAIQLLQVGIDLAAGAGTITQTVNIPAGMAFEITDAEFTCSSVTGTPDISIGDTAAGTQVVAAVACTTNKGALTIKEGTVDAGGLISVTYAATASESVRYGCLTLAGYVSAPPTTLASRP